MATLPEYPRWESKRDKNSWRYFMHWCPSVGLLINPTNTILSGIQTRDLKLGARSLGLSLPILTAATDNELDAVFARLTELQVKSMIIGSDAFSNSRSEALAELAIRHQVPAIAPYR